MANVKNCKISICLCSEFYRGEEGLNEAYDWPEAEATKDEILPQFCAALFYDQWHRGQIIRQKGRNQFLVKYIDYGTLASIPRSHVKKLDEQFTKFPSQAIRARLATIIPPFGESWKEEASKVFMKMVRDTKDDGLVANIRGVSLPEKCVCIWLYDTVTNDSKNGIQVNNELFKKGLAVRETDESYLQAPNKLRDISFSSNESDDDDDDDDGATFQVPPICAEMTEIIKEIAELRNVRNPTIFCFSSFTNYFKIFLLFRNSVKFFLSFFRLMKRLKMLVTTIQQKYQWTCLIS